MRGREFPRLADGTDRVDSGDRSELGYEVGQGLE